MPRTKRNQSERLAVALDAQEHGDAIAARKAHCSVATVANYRNEFGISIASRQQMTEKAKERLIAIPDAALPEIISEYTPEIALHAAQTSSDPDVLRALAEHYPHPYVDVLEYIVDNQHCPSDLFDKIANTALKHPSNNTDLLWTMSVCVSSDNADVAVRIAELAVSGQLDIGENMAASSRLPIEALEILIEHPDPEVRAQVVGHRKAHDQLLDKAAADPSEAVREIVAAHHNTSQSTVLRLTRDKKTLVSDAAKRNPNLGLIHLVHLVETDPQAVAENPASTTELLLEITLPETPERLKMAILNHPNSFARNVSQMFPNTEAIHYSSNYLLANATRHPDAPADFLSRVAYTSDDYLTSSDLYCNVILHPHTAEEALLDILDFDGRAWRTVIYRDTPTEQIIRKVFAIAEDYDFHNPGEANAVFEKVLSIDATPSDIKEKLINRTHS